MPQSDEQALVDDVVSRLSARFPALDPFDVDRIVQNAYHRFDGGPIRDFVPLLVERLALDHLRTGQPAPAMR